MPTRQSSAEMSSLASRVLQMELKGAIGDKNRVSVPVSDYNRLLTDAKKLAGSVLSQDETPMRKVGRFLELANSGRAEPFARR